MEEEVGKRNHIALKPDVINVKAAAIGTLVVPNQRESKSFLVRCDPTHFAKGIAPFVPLVFFAPAHKHWSVKVSKALLLAPFFGFYNEAQEKSPP